MVASYNAAFANLISALGPYLSRDCFFFVDFQRSSLLPHACVSAMPMCLRKAEKKPRLQSCHQGGYSPWYGPIMSAIWMSLGSLTVRMKRMKPLAFWFEQKLEDCQHARWSCFLSTPAQGLIWNSQSTATNRPWLFWCIFMHVQLCYFWTWRLWFSTPLSNGADCEKFQSAACTNTDGFLMPIWRPSTFTFCCLTILQHGPRHGKHFKLGLRPAWKLATAGDHKTIDQDIFAANPGPSWMISTRSWNDWHDALLYVVCVLAHFTTY